MLIKTYLFCFPKRVHVSGNRYNTATNKPSEDNEWWARYANHSIKKCITEKCCCVQNSVVFDRFWLKTIWTDQYCPLSSLLCITGCWVLPYKVICAAILKAGLDITPVQPPKSVSVYCICQNYQNTWGKMDQHNTKWVQIHTPIQMQTHSMNAHKVCLGFMHFQLNSPTSGADITCKMYRESWGLPVATYSTLTDDKVEIYIVTEYSTTPLHPSHDCYTCIQKTDSIQQATMMTKFGPYTCIE